MKIAIVTDTNAGFTEKEIEGKDIYILRMPVLINNEVFFEGYTITDDQFYKRMEADDDIKTSQPAPGEVINLWEKLLKDYDQVIHIPMSSGLSASCQTAKTLAEEDFKDKFYEITQGYELYLKMSLKYCTTTNIELVDILDEYARKITLNYETYEKFLIAKFISLTPSIYLSLFKILCLLSHPVSIDFIKNYSIGKVE